MILGTTRTYQDSTVSAELFKRGVEEGRHELRCAGNGAEPDTRARELRTPSIPEGPSGYMRAWRAGYGKLAHTTPTQVRRRCIEGSPADTRFHGLPPPLTDKVPVRMPKSGRLGRA